jgi:hypothetical protein
LATAFGVDEHALTEQFNKCLPIAQHRAGTLGHSNGAAWKFAVHRLAERMKMDSLSTVLQRYLVSACRQPAWSTRFPQSVTHWLTARRPN